MTWQPNDFIWILAVLELFEAALMYAPTLGEVVERLYGYYRRSVFLFFFVHPTFMFVLFVILITQRFNIALLVLVALKVFDIFYKLEIIKARYIRRSVPPELAHMLSFRMPWWIYLTGVMLYVSLLYWGLS